MLNAATLAANTSRDAAGVTWVKSPFDESWRAYVTFDDLLDAKGRKLGGELKIELCPKYSGPDAELHFRVVISETRNGAPFGRWGRELFFTELEAAQEGARSVMRERAEEISAREAAPRTSG